MIKYTELSAEQKDFLKGYAPKTEGFTSWSEMDEITKVLNLASKKSADDVTAIRNSVVAFYHDFIKSDFRFMDAMQSVTAVCDHYIYTIHHSL